MAEGPVLVYNIPTTHYNTASIAIRGLNEALIHKKWEYWDEAKKTQTSVFQLKSPDVAQQMEPRLTVKHQTVLNGRIGGVPVDKYAKLSLQLVLYHEFETSTGEKLIRPTFAYHEYQVPQDVPWDLSSMPWQAAQYVFRAVMSDNDTAYSQNRFSLLLQGITDIFSEPLT